MQTQRISPLALSVAVGIGALVIGYGLGAALTIYGQSQSRMVQEPFVNKALDLYGHGRVPRSELLRRYSPVVVYLPDMTCVAMKFRKPTAGGEDTMCFDKGQERLLFTYSSGD